MGICQAFFLPLLRRLLPQRPSRVSFRAKQTGFFLLLRSCEVAGLRSQGISLLLFPFNSDALTDRLHSATIRRAFLVRSSRHFCL
jgi:hypothetical protein